MIDDEALGDDAGYRQEHPILSATNYPIWIIGFALMLCSFGGGLFIPLSQFSDTWRTIAEFTPLWGLNGLVHAALQDGTFNWRWPVNLIVWLCVFVGGAAWRFSRDTTRV